MSSSFWFLKIVSKGESSVANVFSNARVSVKAGYCDRGPLPTEEVVRLIQSRQVAWFDLALKSGESEWKTLLEIQEFASMANAQPLDEVASDRSLGAETRCGPREPVRNLWVVLRRSKSDGGEKKAKVQGPYSDQEIENLIQKGEIAPEDFLRRFVLDGSRPEWCRVGEIFDTTVVVPGDRVSDAFVFVPEINERGLIDSVIRATVPVQGGHGCELDERRPQEAAGEDLVESPAWMSYLSR